jgi:hypothetical protein
MNGRGVGFYKTKNMLNHELQRITRAADTPRFRLTEFGFA